MGGSTSTLHIYDMLVVQWRGRLTGGGHGEAFWLNEANSSESFGIPDRSSGPARCGASSRRPRLVTTPIRERRRSACGWRRSVRTSVPLSWGDKGDARSHKASLVTAQRTASQSHAQSRRRGKRRSLQLKRLWRRRRCLDEPAQLQVGRIGRRHFGRRLKPRRVVCAPARLDQARRQIV